MATPIGDLGDITWRAVDVLRRCDGIACEDTRVTGKLLKHLGISKPMWRYDDHSEHRDRTRLVESMRDRAVALVSDARGVRFPGLFAEGPNGIQTHVLPAGRFQLKKPQGWARAVREMMRGRAMARELYRTFKPAAVIGFGGYPAMPALLAAFADKIPTAVHEQNAVLGRVNRLVARRVDATSPRS
mgnify:CR=1 FL=1